MEFKIEKKVPVPNEHNIGKTFIDFIDKLDVGDSFEFLSKHYSHCSVAITRIKIKTPTKKFMTRSIGDSKRRVWRIE